MKRPVDIDQQIEKLYGLRTKRPREMILKFTDRQIERMKTLSSEKRWAYDLNRHQALIELRDALKAEISHAKLKEAIARKDAERGRPLTDCERLENLKKMLNRDESSHAD